MLGFLKIHNLNSTNKEHYSVVELINSVLSYFKGFSLFDAVLSKQPQQQPGTQQSEDKDDSSAIVETKNGLFPSTIKYDHTLLKESSAVPCSTVDQPLFKMGANENGVISWDYSESQANTTDTIDLKYADIPDLPNPEFFDIELNKKPSNDTELSVSPSTDDSHSPIMESSPNTSTSGHSSCDDGKDEKSKIVYPCEFCGAEFKIRGYLTRHIKKHALTKAYECPFYDEHSENKCHPNGGFSRRDTYKTHLKARHFKYPKGTKSPNRTTTPGHCGSCFKAFANNEEWVEKHIESGECTGLPKGYQIRVKNTRRKHYEFPSSRSDSNGINSPVSMTSNSPEQFHSSLQQTQHLQQQQQLMKMISMPPSLPKPKHQQNSLFLSNSPLSMVSSSREKISFETLDFEHYDNNDEFSLDVEQSLSYRPMCH